MTIMPREQEIVRHYQDNFQEGRIGGVQKVALRYAMPRKRDSSTALIIVGGRTECLEKYREVFFDLRSLDVDIYSYDHRGQGLSERMLDDPCKGHVVKFTNYLEDLNIFLERIVNGASQYHRILVLAHSMGGAIATLYHHDYPGVIDGLLLTSPMFGIKSGLVPTSVAEWLAATMVRLGKGERYIFGRSGEVYNLKYADNPLTSSAERFAYSLRLFQDNPQLILGSPSFTWLHEAYRSIKRLGKISFEGDGAVIPMMLLQAENDRVVSASGQRRFLRNNPSCWFYLIKGARHELLMEKDSIRNEVLDIVREFINQLIPVQATVDCQANSSET